MSIKVAIVDYEMGNLFSVKQACHYAGMEGTITDSRREIEQADGVILPGVGAYGDAMRTLHRLDLVTLLQDIAASGKPLVGICLGQQLLMTESHEFGKHQGLGLIPGTVERFDKPSGMIGAGEKRVAREFKVPQIGWNTICQPPGATWTASPLQGLDSGEMMYFVHSFYTRPEDPAVVLASSVYGNIEFASSLQLGNVFTCQFHPERSGPKGLLIYQNIARMIEQSLGA